jgi:hypothetical protein
MSLKLVANVIKILWYLLFLGLKYHGIFGQCYKNTILIYCSTYFFHG